VVTRCLAHTDFQRLLLLRTLFPFCGRGLRHRRWRCPVLHLQPHAPGNVRCLLVWASARPRAGSKGCAHVLSVPGAAVAFASAGKGRRGIPGSYLFSSHCRIKLLNKREKWTIFPTVSSSHVNCIRKYLHVLLWVSTHPVCMHYLFASITTGYIEDFLCITILRHFHSVFENHSFHAHTYVISPRSL